jgi:phosphoglycolate phosphatase-like HAD superfamily hydrolase
MAIKAVIFDLDGTIVSPNLDVMAVRAEVRGFLLRVGVPASVLATNESIFEMLKKTETFMKNNGKPEKAIENVRRKALAIAERYELEAARSTSLLSGVGETLKSIKSMGLKIGLCTINGEKSMSYILKRFKIAEFFDVLFPRDKVKYVKPNAEHLEVALKALEVNADEAIIVGDGVSDMRCGRELGVIAVGLPTGFSSLKELTSAGANYIMTSIADLPSLIRRIDTR